MTGGVLAVHVDDYLELNGFSNLFTGWGGEDDDLYNRKRYFRFWIYWHAGIEHFFKMNRLQTTKWLNEHATIVDHRNSLH